MEVIDRRDFMKSMAGAATVAALDRTLHLHLGQGRFFFPPGSTVRRRTSARQRSLIVGGPFLMRLRKESTFRRMIRR